MDFWSRDMIYILGVPYIELGKSFPNSFIASLFDLDFCASHSRCTLVGFIQYTVYCIYPCAEESGLESRSW